MPTPPCYGFWSICMKRVVLLLFSVVATASAASMSFPTPAVHSSVLLSPAAPLLGNATMNVQGVMSGGERSFGSGDFNGDGCPDMVFAPSYYAYFPNLPIVIWLGDCKGHFRDGTSEVIDGPITETGVVNNVFIADFNGDGRDDIFMVDQGHENSANCEIGPCFGGLNTILLSQPDGRLKDTTRASLPNQAANFNHPSGVGDLNGDGAPDIALARLGGPHIPGSGIALLINDGHGRFTETTQGLPPEIAYVLAGDRNYGKPFRNVGTVTVADLDGDGLPELIVADYDQGAWNPERGNWDLTQRGVGVYQRDAKGNYAEVWRSTIPTAISTIPYSSDPANKRLLGACSINVADYDGDGQPDIAVVWEGFADTEIVMLRHLAGWQFQDATLSLLGRYKTSFVRNGWLNTVGTILSPDLNGDGVADLVLGTGSDISSGADALTSPAATNLYLGSRGGALAPLQPSRNGKAMTTADFLQAMAPCAYDCSTTSFHPFIFDVNGDGVADLVLMDAGSGFETLPGGILRTHRIDFYTLLSSPATNQFVLQNIGAITNRTIGLKLTPGELESQKPVDVFFAALARSKGTALGLFIADSKGGWQPFSDCEHLSAFYSGTMTSQPLPVLTQLDLSSLIGSDFYVGYAEAGGGIAKSCQDMVANGRVRRVGTLH